MRSFLEIFDWSEHSPISSLFICILSLSVSLRNKPNTSGVKKNCEGSTSLIVSSDLPFEGESELCPSGSNKNIYVSS